MIPTREQILNIVTSDCDYYICAECKQDMVNMGSRDGHHLGCWCNNGCDFHGDVYFFPTRKYPRKAKEYLLGIVK